MRITVFDVFYLALALGVGGLASHLAGAPHRIVAFVVGFAVASGLILVPTLLLPLKYVAYPPCAATACTSGSYRVIQVRAHECDVLCSCGARYLARFIRLDGAPGQQFMRLDGTGTPQPYMCRSKRNTPWIPEHVAA